MIFHCHAQYRVGIVNLLKVLFPEETAQEEQPEHAGVPCRFSLRVEEHALVITRPGKDTIKSRMFLLTGFDVEDKALICRTLYEMLGCGTGKTLKWGILTESGVLSMAEQMIKTGWSDPEALSLCKRKYFISEEKK